MEAERQRLGTKNVRLLVLTTFTDGTNLDKLGRNVATPILLSLLNFTQEVLSSGVSKKILGYYPGVPLSKEEKDNAQVKDFVRAVHDYVTSLWVKDLAALYDEGGLTWVDHAGVEYHLVPVLAFTTTDVEAARWLKGLREGWNVAVPCHLCTASFKGGSVKKGNGSRAA